MTIITSKDNPSVKLYSKLSSSKKERNNYKMYVLEGYRLICEALSESNVVSQIFFTEDAYNKYYNDLSQVDLKEVKVLIISNELGIKISETEKTQGIFAICKMSSKLDLKNMVKPDGKYVVLYQLQDPGNLGMIIRTADAFGIDGVILSESCELYNPKVIRSTMGSVFHIKIAHGCAIDEVFEVFNEKNISSYAAVVDSGAVSLKKCSFENGGAVLIGNEGNGLPDDIADMCTQRITIHMSGNANSLNAAMATGIIMWEMTSDSEEKI